jgi:hypothetical protein
VASEKTVVSFRLSPLDYSALEQAAQLAGESTSEYARRAVLLRIGGGMPIRVLPNTSFNAPYIAAEFEIPPLNTSALSNLVQDEYVRKL